MISCVFDLHRQFFIVVKRTSTFGIGIAIGVDIETDCDPDTDTDPDNAVRAHRASHIIKSPALPEVL
jgi:hypothetical protein